MALVVGCGTSGAPSPFQLDAPDAAPEAGLPEGGPEAPAPDAAPPELGAPCVDDGQCDDSIPCTFDACDDAWRRCRFMPDDSACADESFCNGVEVCDHLLGCRSGPIASCSDFSACTIESCNDELRLCQSVERDADGDGDVDINCGGGDCDERTPAVSSLAEEICGNETDDDCDGDTDEDACTLPAHDDCQDALDIAASGTWEVVTTALRSDFAASCVEVVASTRDFVLAVTIPGGELVDVDVTATASGGTVQLAAASACGDASTEMFCAAAAATPSDESAARLRLRGLEPGTYFVYGFTDATWPVAVKVRYETHHPEPENETCATAAELIEGVPVALTLVDAATDLATACDAAFGELTYAFVLEETRDVRLFAHTTDGLGIPAVSLRTEACALGTDEIVCRAQLGGDVFWRGLGPGTYFVAVSATGPTDAELLLTTSAASEAPADERCATAPVLVQNRTIDVELAAHVDDVRFECSAGRVDAAYELDLEARADVLLVERFPVGDSGAVVLAGAACASALGCATSSASPVRLAEHDLAPGSYRVVVETDSGTNASLTPLVRPARAPVAVAFADGCADAVELAPEGGFFMGTTANAVGDFGASCDIDLDANGADQMLRLDLDARRRVVFDMQGSGHSTLLLLRRGPECPGAEVEGGCSVGYAPERSYLDLELEAGTYFIQIDGYAGSEGSWFLDVFVVEP